MFSVFLFLFFFFFKFQHQLLGNPLLCQDLNLQHVGEQQGGGRGCSAPLPPVERRFI